MYGPNFRAPDPAAYAGALESRPDAEQTRIRVSSFNEETFEVRTLELDEDFPQPTEGRMLWIDVVGLGDRKRLTELREAYGIHRLVIADLVNTGQRPKAATIASHTYALAAMASLRQKGRIDLEQVGIVIGPGWLITVQERIGDVFDPVRQRIREGLGQVRLRGSDYLAYALLDALIDAYYPVAEALDAQVSELENSVFIEEQAESPAAAFRLVQRLLHFEQLMRQHRDLLTTLIRSEDPVIDKRTRPYLEDAHDNCVQLLEHLQVRREATRSLVDLSLSLANNRMNDVMRLLTVISAVFIPLTFIASIYGMNFASMPELQNPNGYYVVLGIMATIASVLVFLFRRRGWL